MEVVHRRIDAQTGVAVVWLCDRTRPFGGGSKKADFRSHSQHKSGHRYQWPS